MSAERTPNEDRDRHEITLDVPFKPFEKERRFFWPKRGEKPFVVPEDYDYALALRKKVSFRGIEGYIDVIQEDPIHSMAELFVGMGKGAQLDKPMGETAFHLLWGKDSAKVKEAPQIVRVTFLTKTPADYSKLLGSYIDVKCGDEMYLMAWNLDRPLVKERMACIEKGNELLIVEKNLLNQKPLDEPADFPDLPDLENKSFGRVGFVWLPRDIKKLRTLAFTFRRFGSDDQFEELVSPTPPIEKPEPVLV